MAIVIDASVLTPFLVDHELSNQVQKFRSAKGVILPALAFVETANAVWKYVRAGRADLRQLTGVRYFLHEYASEVIDDRELLTAASRLAATNNHPIYDCLYLALAQERNIPLATADKKLAKLAEQLSIKTELIRPSA